MQTNKQPPTLLRFNALHAPIRIDQIKHRLSLTPHLLPLQLTVSQRMTPRRWLGVHRLKRIRVLLIDRWLTDRLSGQLLGERSDRVTDCDPSDDGRWRLGRKLGLGARGRREVVVP